MGNKRKTEKKPVRGLLLEKYLVKFLGKKMRKEEKEFLLNLAKAIKESSEDMSVETGSLESFISNFIKFEINEEGYIVLLNCEMYGVGVEDDFIKKLVLPSKLQCFDCSANGLFCLPDLLPNSLKILDCSVNKLKSLPKLPKKLKKLICFGNDFDEKTKKEIKKFKEKIEEETVKTIKK